MRSNLVPATLPGMNRTPRMPNEWVRLTIEVDPRTEPVRGFFDDGRRGRLPFAGMLELLALLEAARHAPDDSSSGAV